MRQYHVSITGRGLDLITVNHFVEPQKNRFFKGKIEKRIFLWVFMCSFAKARGSAQEKTQMLFENITSG